MFTLGKTPYPGIEPGERFYDMLVKGYRQVSHSRRYHASLYILLTYVRPVPQLDLIINMYMIHCVEIFCHT